MAAVGHREIKDARITTPLGDRSSGGNRPGRGPLAQASLAGQDVDVLAPEAQDFLVSEGMDLLQPARVLGQLGQFFRGSAKDFGCLV